MNYYVTVELFNDHLKSSLFDNRGCTLNDILSEFDYSKKVKTVIWYDAFMKSLVELTQNINREDIMSIIFSDENSEIVLLNRMDDPIRDSVELKRLEDDYILETLINERLREYSGNYGLKKSLANTLLYLKKYEPDTFQRMSKVLYRKDYLIYRLTGSYSIDSVTASKTQLYDTNNGYWNGELLDRLEIDPTILPMVFNPGDQIGRLSEPDLIELGFSMDTLIVASTSREELDKIITLGFNEGNTHFYFDEKGKISYNLSSYSQGNETYKLFNAIFGKSLETYFSSGVIESKWFNDKNQNEKEFDLSNMIEGKDDFKDSFYVPYVRNEDGKVMGNFYNVDYSYDDDDMLLLTLEGCALKLKSLLENLIKDGHDMETVSVSGALTKCPYYMKVLANVLNKRIDVRRRTEDPSLSLASISYVSLNEFDTLTECINFVNPVVKSYIPNEEEVISLGEKYLKFKKLEKGNV